MQSTMGIVAVIDMPHHCPGAPAPYLLIVFIVTIYLPHLKCFYFLKALNSTICKETQVLVSDLNLLWLTPVAQAHHTCTSPVSYIS